MAAAIAAATCNKSVLVLDDNAAAGGQIWRKGVEVAGRRAKTDARKTRQMVMREAFEASDAELLAGRRVVDAPRPGMLRTVVETADGSVQESFSWERLILATGARERFLPFPGWTLPGVLGAGGLQALVKGGYDVRGKRVVVAGTGPLLVAVAAHLQQRGATVVCVAEQAPLGRLMPFVAGLWSHPVKLYEGIRYGAALAGAPYRMGWWPVAVEKDASGMRVRLTDGKRTLVESCDLVACGFHLVPNTELAELLGCTLRDGAVVVDELQRTSVENVFCAGEPTGIAGLDAALVQGEIAGLAAAGQDQAFAGLERRRAKERAFGERLNAAFRLRPEVCSLAAADTMVCRCEDVSYARLQEHTGWTEAKLQTRCGMGPCQGRVCGPAVQSLFGWRAGSVRPPIFPIPISAFGSNDNEILEEVATFQETE
jgi:NADPH-dependent 2,4-dienoyl-CoA reductase/sulfur reductase-like enzyme